MRSSEKIKMKVIYELTKVLTYLNATYFLISQLVFFLTAIFMGNVLQADLTEGPAILTGDSLLTMALVNVIILGLEIILVLLTHRHMR